MSAGAVRRGWWTAQAAKAVDETNSLPAAPAWASQTRETDSAAPRVS